MKEEFIVKGHTLSEFKNNIRNYDYFIKEFSNYNGTNLRKANIILNKVLDEEEKDTLFELLLGDLGWYRKINKAPSIKLKVVANALGFAHDNFQRERLSENEIMNVLSKITENELNLIVSIYLKQKIITKKTLMNYQDSVKNKNRILIKDNKLTLYRGIKGNIDDSLLYRTNTLESWTTNFNLASRFTGLDGYILKMDIDIDDIFCCKKSTFKHPNKKSVNQTKYIRKEHEYVVEHLEEDKKLYIDKDTHIINIL